MTSIETPKRDKKEHPFSVPLLRSADREIEIDRKRAKEDVDTSTIHFQFICQYKRGVKEKEEKSELFVGDKKKGNMTTKSLSSSSKSIFVAIILWISLSSFSSVRLPSSSSSSFQQQQQQQRQQAFVESLFSGSTSARAGRYATRSIGSSGSSGSSATMAVALGRQQQQQQQKRRTLTHPSNKQSSLSVISSSMTFHHSQHHHTVTRCTASTTTALAALRSSSLSEFDDEKLNQGESKENVHYHHNNQQQQQQQQHRQPQYYMFPMFDRITVIEPLLQQMKDKLISNDKQSLTQLYLDSVYALCYAYDHKEGMEEVIEMMKKVGRIHDNDTHSHSVSTYKACIQACYDVRNGDGALDILSQMYHKGFCHSPSSASASSASSASASPSLPTNKNMDLYDVGLVLGAMCRMKTSTTNRRRGWWRQPLEYLKHVVIVPPNQQRQEWQHQTMMTMTPTYPSSFSSSSDVGRTISTAATATTAAADASTTSSSRSAVVLPTENKDIPSLTSSSDIPETTVTTKDTSTSTDTTTDTTTDTITTINTADATSTTTNTTTISTTVTTTVTTTIITTTTSPLRDTTTNAIGSNRTTTTPGTRAKSTRISSNPPDIVANDETSTMTKTTDMMPRMTTTTSIDPTKKANALPIQVYDMLVQCMIEEKKSPTEIWNFLQMMEDSNNNNDQYDDDDDDATEKAVSSSTSVNGKTSSTRKKTKLQRQYITMFQNIGMSLQIHRHAKPELSTYMMILLYFCYYTTTATPTSATATATATTPINDRSTTTTSTGAAVAAGAAKTKNSDVSSNNDINDDEELSYKYILQLLHAMKRNGIKVPIKTFDLTKQLLTIFLQRYEWDDMMNVWDTLNELGAKKTWYHYKHVLSTCANVGQVDVAMEFLSKFQRREEEKDDGDIFFYKSDYRHNIRKDGEEDNGDDTGIDAFDYEDDIIYTNGIGKDDDDDVAMSTMMTRPVSAVATGTTANTSTTTTTTTTEANDNRNKYKMILYDLAMIACHKSGRWEEALSVLEQCEQHGGIIPDVRTYTRAMKTCLKAGMPSKSLELFQKVKMKGLIPNTLCYAIAIDSYLSMRNFDETIQLLKEMDERYIPADRWLYSLCLTEILRDKKRWDLALTLFNEMEEKELAITAGDYRAAIWACEKAGQGARAVELLNLMRKKGMWKRIDQVVYNYALAALVHESRLRSKSSVARGKRFTPTQGQKSTAVKLLQQMKKDGIKPNDYSYTNVIFSCAWETRWKEAVEVFNHVKGGGSDMPDVDGYMYNAVVLACARGQQTKYALTFLKDMFKEGITPNRATYKAVFKACKATQDSETARYLWEKMSTNRDSKPLSMANSADRDIAMEYISTLIMTDQNFEIDQILQDLNISRDKTGYRFVVDACLSAQMFDKASDLMKEMIKGSTVLERTDYESYVNAFGAARRWADVLMLFEEMESKGMSHSDGSYRYAISACAETGKGTQAMEILNTMKETGRMPVAKLEVYKQVLAAIVKESRAMGLISSNFVCDDVQRQHNGKNGQGRGFQLLQQMKEDGIVPDEYTYSFTILCSAWECRWEEAMTIFNLVKSGGRNMPAPTSFLYHAAILACGRDGQTKRCLELYHDMKNEGLATSPSTYLVMFKACKAMGDVETAHYLWNDMRSTMTTTTTTTGSQPSAATSSSQSIKQKYFLILSNYIGTLVESENRQTQNATKTTTSTATAASSTSTCGEEIEEIFQTAVREQMIVLKYWNWVYDTRNADEWYVVRLTIRQMFRDLGQVPEYQHQRIRLITGEQSYKLLHLPVKEQEKIKKAAAMAAVSGNNKNNVDDEKPTSAGSADDGTSQDDDEYGSNADENTDYSNHPYVIQHVKEQELQKYILSILQTDFEPSFTVARRSNNSNAIGGDIQIVPGDGSIMISTSSFRRWIQNGCKIKPMKI